MYPPVKKKPEEKTSLGPASYNVDTSFKNSQIGKPRFFMSNVKNKNFIESQI